MTDQATIALRPAEPADAESIATLFTDEGYPAGPSDIVARLGRFAGPDARVIVAEHDGALLGFIAIHALPRFEHDDWIVRILALVVDAGARERGVGRTLMAEAERVGAEIGAAFIEVTAGHHRPEARHLYEQLGYDASVSAYLRKKL
jgi:GNAT superfamily N-acetyltransferase